MVLDRDRKKLNQRHEKILAELLSLPGNNVCADCSQTGPRWASFNIGVFLCIRCASIHRKMGTHISRVKSVNLDSWTVDQIESMRQVGNVKVNSVYLPDPTVRRPPVDSDFGMEQFIRDKYERKVFLNMAAASSQAKKSANGDAMQNRLRDMGFTDPIRNSEALRRANNDLTTAVEFLCSETAPSSVSLSTKSSTNQPPVASTTVDLLGGYEPDEASSAPTPLASSQPTNQILLETSFIQQPSGIPPVIQEQLTPHAQPTQHSKLSKESILSLFNKPSHFVHQYPQPSGVPLPQHTVFSQYQQQQPAWHASVSNPGQAWSSLGTGNVANGFGASNKPPSSEPSAKSPYYPPSSYY